MEYYFIPNQQNFFRKKAATLVFIKDRRKRATAIVSLSQGSVLYTL
jgi:hypothetical protein